MEQPFGEDGLLIPNARVGFQSHFHAMLNAVGFVLPAGGAWTRILWDNVLDDVLGEFNLVNSTFVPIVTGYYVLMGTIVTHNVTANNYTQIDLRVNGAVYDDQLIQQTFLGWHYHKFHVLMHLNAGDIVEVIGRNSDPINNVVLQNLISYTWFSGHRLS